ncbi:hypothetical protein V6N13_065312 [Hibiscus sabdariffa]
MVNPNEFGSSNAVADGLAEGNHKGRPPDTGMCVDSPTSLEGPGSLPCVEGQSTNKKNHNLINSASDIHMGNDTLVQSRAIGGITLPGTDHRAGEDFVGVDTRQTNLSFRDKL